MPVEVRIVIAQPYLPTQDAKCAALRLRERLYVEAKMRKTILTLLGSVPTTRTHFVGEVPTWQFGDWIGIGVVIATELFFLYLAFS